MIIKSPTGQTITSFEEWESYFANTSSKAKHWKEGRSAYSLADFIMNHNGTNKINEIVSEVSGQTIKLNEGIIEQQVSFDSFGKGREHDLGIMGQTRNGKSIFIGVEAKVDESFNETIGEVYLKAKSREINGESTNAPARIESLMKKHFKKVKSEFFNLRYQLLYATSGTLGVEADLHVLLILVFKTSSFNEIRGRENYKDFLQFISLIESKKSNQIQELRDMKQILVIKN